MRERMDFSSIVKIFLENRGTDRIAQSELYMQLFNYAFHEAEICPAVPDDGIISNTIKGKRNVVKDIIYIYQAKESLEYFQQDVAAVMDEMADPEYVGERLQELMMNDTSISLSKRNELISFAGDVSVFATQCLLFSLFRPFVARKSSRSLGENVKLILSDYLLDDKLPSIGRNFYGREREMADLHHYFENDTQLFLEGIAGIGKSELAKHFAHECKQKYNNILYLYYTKNLYNTIVSLDFIEDTFEQSEEQRFKNHYRLFKMLGADTLVVLDNFNNVPDEEELFHDFLNLDFAVLVTTRSHIPEVNTMQIEEISCYAALEELLCTFYPAGKKYPKEIEALIEEVYRHTLTVELLGKTLASSGLRPGDMLEHLRKEGLRLSDPNKVALTKDARTKKERLYKHIQTLFAIQNMNLEAVDVLRNMALMPDSGISKVLFHQWRNTIDFNVTNTLVDYGWIQEDINQNQIMLHPFLKEVVITETKPILSNCSTLLQGIYTNCIFYGIDVPYYNDLLNTIFSICTTIEFDDSGSAMLFMDSTIAYLLKYERVEEVKQILEIFRQTIPMSGEHVREKAIYCLYSGYICYLESDYKSSIKHYECGLQAIEPIHSVYASLASNLYNNLGQARLGLLDHKGGLRDMEKAIAIQKDFHLPDTHDTVVQALNYAIVLCANDRRQEGKRLLFRLIKQIRHVPDSGMTTGTAYKYLGMIVMDDNLADAVNYLNKSLRLIRDHLGVASEEVVEIQSLIKQAEMRMMLPRKKI